MRIGILLTSKKQEFKKQEMINTNSHSRKYLKNAPDNLCVFSKKKKLIPADAAMGVYLETHYKNMIVDYILPNEITPVRLKKNDMNFMIIYDLLEAYHNEPKEVFEQLKNTLEKANNIYPPYDYQQYINNKCTYYADLHQKNIPVVPTICRYDTNAEELLKDIKFQEWEKAIAKPIYGQESKLFKKFKTLNPDPMKKHMKIITEKYGLPGTIFQEYIKGFDAEQIESRTYFVGDDYKYSIYTDGAHHVWRPKEEGGSKRWDGYKTAKKLGKDTLKKLPKIVVNGIVLPKLLTRIDVSCCLEGKNKYSSMFVNECEFVPSLYIEEKTPTQIEVDLAKQMYKITKLFLDKKGNKKTVKKTVKKTKKKRKTEKTTQFKKRGPKRIYKKKISLEDKKTTT
tara:strand:- start:38 stop:1225 length:1188 start_codon:yes stop_codon:yes gene_type:complete